MAPGQPLLGFGFQSLPENQLPTGLPHKGVEYKRQGGGVRNKRPIGRSPLVYCATPAPGPLEFFF